MNFEKKLLMLCSIPEQVAIIIIQVGNADRRQPGHLLPNSSYMGNWHQ
jgi:hypothetical protein